LRNDYFKEKDGSRAVRGIYRCENKILLRYDRRVGRQNIKKKHIDGAFKEFRGIHESFQMEVFVALTQSAMALELSNIMTFL
jgi:hypothetical protein